MWVGRRPEAPRPGRPFRQPGCPTGASRDCFLICCLCMYIVYVYVYVEISKYVYVHVCAYRMCICIGKPTGASRDLFSYVVCVLCY